MMLSLSDISFNYGKNQILKDVSLDLEGGGLYGLVGENGSGKTTLLRIIIGELRNYTGEVKIKGTIGYCPQKTLLFPELTVLENFKYFAAAYGITQEFDLVSDALMDQFNFSYYKKHLVKQLSGGTQQKLNLSLALLHDPDILILDEPYSGYDWDTYLKFLDYTDKAVSAGKTIIIVTHMLAERQRYNKIFTLQEGQLS